MKLTELSDDYFIVICTLKSDAIFVVPGSVVKKCIECGKDILVAPSTAPAMKGKKHALACIGCVMNNFETLLEKGIKMNLPTPEQLQELANVFGKNKPKRN